MAVEPGACSRTDGLRRPPLRHNDVRRPSPNVLESHESEIHELISGAVALQVKLAALDKSTYERVAPYVSTLINLSEDVDAAVDTYKEREKPAAAELQACNERALDYVKKLPSEIANLLG
jgi:hypothetical protein